MKKLLILLMLITLAPTAVFASAAKNYDTYACVDAYDMSNSFARILTNALSANIWAEKYAQSLAKKIIKESAGAQFKVKIDSFSVLDLKDGRFKGFEMKGENFDSEGMFFTSMKIKTVCNFNYIVPDEKNRTVRFKEALPLRFDAVISEDNLNKTMSSVGYDKIIAELNKAAAKTGFKILEAKAKIRNDKFLYVLRTTVPLLKNPQDFVISTDLKVVNGDIKFEHAQLLNSSFSMDLTKIAQALNFLNPLDYSLNIIENKSAELSLKNVAIKDNKITLDGLIVIPKDIIMK